MDVCGDVGAKGAVGCEMRNEAKIFRLGCGFLVCFISCGQGELSGSVRADACMMINTYDVRRNGCGCEEFESVVSDG